MNTLITLAEAWWPLYAVHMIEVSLFILLVWAVDRSLTLETRLRYALYLLALAKVFVPPVLAIPIPAFLILSTNVAVDDPFYSGVVSDANSFSTVAVTTLPPAFYLFCLWILSVLVWAGVALWKNAAFHRMLKSAIPVELAPEIASLNGTRNLKVYSKSSLPSPTLVGLERPRLYLPSNWSSWSPDELRGVVRHELAHFERRDIYVLILQAVATALFCTNPLIWLLNRKLMYLRELRCDEAVLRETYLTPAEYGRLLLDFVDRRPAPSALTLYLIERETTLKARFEHLLSYKEGEMKRSKWQLVIVLIVGLMVVPFSIRKAYTQNDGGTQVSKSAADGKKAEITPHREVKAVSGHVDSNDVLPIVYDTKEVDVKPHPVQIFGPDYPEEALNSKIDGEVHLKFIVNVDSSVSDVTVLKGPEIFLKAATDAALQWRFRPAMHRGKVVPAWMIMPIGFSLTADLDGKALHAKATKHSSAELPEPQAAPAEFNNGSSDKIYEFWSVDERSVVTHSVEPVYPDAAQKAGLTGSVFMKFKVNVDGSVSHINVMKGKAIFHEAAINAISQYRFHPAKHEGELVPVWMTIPIRFKLSNPNAVPPPDSSDAGADKVLPFWDVDVKPVNLNSHAVRPNYPDSAKEAGLTGNVFLKFKINVDGSVSDVQVMKGDEVFRQSAIGAVRQFRFNPAELDGKPVPVWMTQRIAFALPENQDEAATDSSGIDGNEVFEISEVHVMPVHLNPNDVRPDYPGVARKAGLTGRVKLKFKVNVNGSVSDVHVLEGDEIFRNPAIDAVTQFRYKPAERDGNTVPVWITLPFKFVLPEEQEDAVPETVEPGVGD